MAAAICKLVGGRSTATTAGPDGPLPAAVTAATGVMTPLGKAVVGVGNRGAAVPTAPANTRGVIAATPNAGVRVTRITHCRTPASAGRFSGQTTNALTNLQTKARSLT
ncbi:hypothetical protein MHEC_26690 [Mycobacterium heckeshornense]|uniref:Uncharacterized protein n=1 Tax=Mycobacterium heckeshornense TaxID=110505 RepID=A0A7R7GVV2_9MYCO|nr:hypothetical protein MHEC_26690 [Mycobacterium heckeshornense]